MADPLEELRKRLYKKGESFGARMRRPALTPQPEKAPPFWKENNSMPRSRSPLPKKFLAIVIALFVLGVLTLFYFLGGFNAISGQNINLKIVAPASLEGGERISWEVSVTNSNRKVLETAELIFEYPEGTRVLDPNVRGLRERRSLGKIASEENVKTSFDAFLFGETDAVKKAKVTLEYRSEDSSAILVKEAEFETKILRSPVGVSFDGAGELRAGQDAEIKINYISNASGELANLYLELESPAGFIFKKGIPKSEDDGKTWRLGTLKPGEGGSVIVQGTISGEDLEEKSFKVQVGTKTVSGKFEVYGGGVATVKIRRPFMDIHLALNGERQFIARPGEVMDAEVNFKNNLPVSIQNAVVEVFFEGTGLNERGIRVPDGNYRSSTRSVLWNATSAEILRNLNPGDGGSFRMQFSFLNPMPLRSSEDKNFSLKLRAEIKPSAVPSGFFGTDVRGTDTAEVKLASELQLVRRGFFFANIIPNSGPLPPKVGQETTFTIVWSLTNATNDLDALTVRAALPPYMNWKNTLRPEDSEVSFDESSGEIQWKVGLLRAGTGFLRPAREIAFQVGLVPGANQIGSSPELAGPVLAQGRDLFTNVVLRAEAPALTLELEDDGQVENDQRVVVP